MEIGEKQALEVFPRDYMKHSKQSNLHSGYLTRVINSVYVTERVHVPSLRHVTVPPKLTYCVAEKGQKYHTL